MKRAWLLGLMAGLALPAAAIAQSEQNGYRGWGPRVGLTIDPDQFHFGMHLDLGQLAKQVRFQPNVEIGVSDDLTVAAFNFEAAYRFRERWDTWSPYLGGGPGVNVVNRDGRGNDTDTGLGLNVLGGIERGLSNGNRFFTEMKLGLMDDPDVKMTVGWTFYH